jgi:hypothetical protein
MEESNAKPIPASTLRSRKRRAKMTANERTRERAFYAAKRRTDLARLLSPDGRCDSCSETFPHEELEIDHVDGRLWMLDEVSPSVRSARYWKEYKAGVRMRALCKVCNGTDGGSRRYGGLR